MRTTSPTRPPIRNGPATAASDIFGGLLARLYLRRLPSKLGCARTLRAARPIHFSSIQLRSLWWNWSRAEGSSLPARHARPNIPRCTERPPDYYRCVAGCPKFLSKILHSKLVPSIWERPHKFHNGCDVTVKLKNSNKKSWLRRAFAAESTCASPEED